MLGAGKKDSNNRFEGVLMGDVRKGAEDTEAGTGLFGYKDGVQSFGFLTGGTAFLGKAAKAQIKFDGEDGTIMNANYNNGTGIKISMSGNEDAKQSISIKKNHFINGNIKDVEHVLISSDNPYLRIKSDVGNTLLHIGNDNYYLQTDNFSDINQTGTYLNLKSGKLTGYDFNLKLVNSSDSNKFIKINSNALTYPLEIGNNFNVKWDGTLYSNKGIFKYADIDNADIDSADVNDCNIDNCDIGNCDIDNCSIGSCDIGNCNIGDCDVTGTLSGGTITGATISANGYVTCSGLKVGGVDYGMSDLSKVYFITSGEVHSVASPGRVTVTGSITDSKGKPCSFDLHVVVPMAGAGPFFLADAWQRSSSFRFLGQAKLM